MNHDQATTLRNIATSTPRPLNARSAGNCRSIAITGGKGGVGKSNIAANLAIELGKLGNQVALLDADFALANADLICGVLPKFHFGHVVAGVKTLNEIAIDLSDNSVLIPGGSGLEELANFSLDSSPDMLSQIRAFEKSVDFLLIDTAAGIADNVSSILMAASSIVVVVTPEPASIVDAYSTIKLVVRRTPLKPISIVVNDVIGVGDAEQVFRSISAASLSFLNTKVTFLGMVPHDERLQLAVREQIPVVRYSPDAAASRAIRLIAKNVHQKTSNRSSQNAIESFWSNLARN